MRLFFTVFLFFYVAAKVFAFDPVTVLQNAQKYSCTYDFTTGPGSMYEKNSDGEVREYEILDGSLSRHITKDGPAYLAESVFAGHTSLKGLKVDQIHNANGDFTIYYNKDGAAIYAIQDTSAEKLSTMFKGIVWEYEMLQTILDEWNHVEITDYSTKKFNGIEFYEIIVNFSKSEKCIHLLPPSIAQAGVFETGLLIGAKDYFVYEQSYLKDGEIAAVFNKNDVRIYPGGTLPEDRFQVPQNITVNTAKNEKEMQAILLRGGLSQTQKTVKDITHHFREFFQSFSDFMMQNPKTIGVIIISLGTGIILLALFFVKRRRR